MSSRSLQSPLLTVPAPDAAAAADTEWLEAALASPGKTRWVSPILLEIRIERWGSRPLYISRKLSGKIAVPDKKDHFQ